MEAVTGSDESGMPTTTSVIEWEVAGCAVPGEAESGDLHAVVPFEGGVLVAAVDGLGHGPEARSAAEAAVRTLSQRASEPVVSLIQRCHKALREDARGVVLNLASFDSRKATMTWIGVGNLEGVLWRADPGDGPARRTLVPGAGVVGSRLPTLNPVTMPVQPGDLLVFATDGVSERFLDQLSLHPSLDGVARGILERFGKMTDDALVLAVRYVGPRT